mmetsp:Transcript_35817/g.48386  ORF Transcript_35817/g.48386 Transcript_35817/m.48386 type:complete len:82 (-) Transcript_35817:592-837(-)
MRFLVFFLTLGVCLTAATADTTCWRTINAGVRKKLDCPPGLNITETYITDENKPEYVDGKKKKGRNGIHYPDELCNEEHIK